MTIISVTQMNSQSDIEENFNTVEQLLQQSQKIGAELTVFPENFICFAGAKQKETAERFDEIKQRLEHLAHQYNMWMVAGTLPCPYRPDGSIIRDGRVRTVSLCISPEKTEARYDKIHLFDVDVADGIGRYRESDFFEAGQQAVVAKTPFGNIGLMVCYDIRFPELALTLRQQGANLLTAPSAFTFKTGQMHWQHLLQARAMDTQCHILGSAQGGWHGDKKQRQTWGHAGIAHSNGADIMILQDNDLNTQQVGFISIDFDLNEQQKIRNAMPLMAHRRLSQFSQTQAL